MIVDILFLKIIFIVKGMGKKETENGVNLSITFSLQVKYAGDTEYSF